MLLKRVLFLLACIALFVSGTACAAAEAFPAEYPVGLDMTMEEFDSRASELIREAKTWTAETVPRRLEEFPLMPAPIFDVYKRIVRSTSQLYREGDMYAWVTDIPGLFRENIPDRVDVSMDYVSQGTAVYMPPSLETSDSFLFSLPQGVSIEEIESVSYDCYWKLPGGWDEILQISFPMENGAMTGEVFVGVLFSCDDRSIDWYPGFSVYGRYNMDTISIDIGTVTGHTVNRIWDLKYNTATGRLILMADDNQVIEMEE